MDKLTRRALMGDREAQRQCTENGIILPCPWCKCKVSDLKNTHAIKWFWRKCRFCGAESPAQETEFKANLYWNTRAAPPIGRCKDCAQFKSWGECNQTGDDVQPDDFCSDFYSKEETTNEE